MVIQIKGMWTFRNTKYGSWGGPKVQLLWKWMLWCSFNMWKLKHCNWKWKNNKNIVFKGLETNQCELKKVKGNKPHIGEITLCSSSVYKDQSDYLWCDPRGRPHIPCWISHALSPSSRLGPDLIEPRWCVILSHTINQFLVN
jgi:hypothetical protein